MENAYAFELDGDWHLIASDTERQELADELDREICPAHVLFGIGFVAVGRRWRRDDILFQLDDGRFAQVHLTWRHEDNPAWPSTEIYDNFASWKAVPFEDR